MVHIRTISTVIGLLINHYIIFDIFFAAMTAADNTLFAWDVGIFKAVI